MSDNILAIGLLVLLIFGYFLLRKLSRKTDEMVNQHVFFRKTHREGTDLVTHPMNFRMKGSVAQVKQAVLSNVSVVPSVSTFKGGVYVLRTTEDGIAYGWGNKFNPTNFRAVLSLRALPEGVSGVWEIHDWTESSGVINGVSVMKQMTAEVTAALRGIDPNVIFTYSTVKPHKV